MVNDAKPDKIVDAEQLLDKVVVAIIADIRTTRNSFITISLVLTNDKFFSNLVSKITYGLNSSVSTCINSYMPDILFK